MHPDAKIIIIIIIAGQLTGRGLYFQIRSRVFNLKDKKNRELRENVLCGTIAPDKIATMTSEEMASEEVEGGRAFLLRPLSDPGLLMVLLSFSF